MGDGDERESAGGPGEPTSQPGGPGDSTASNANEPARIDATGQPDATGGRSASGRSASGASRGTGRPPGRPRKDGKPSGSGDRERQEPDGTPIRLRVDQAGRPPKRESISKPKPAAQGEAGDARQVTTAILQLAELAAMATLGPVAKVNAVERAMIEPAMVRILGRMDAAAIGRYSAAADPLMLGMGVCLYGFRVWASSRAAAAASAAAANADSAGDRAPGVSGTPGAAVSPSAPSPGAGQAAAAQPGGQAAAKLGVAPAPLEILTGIETNLEGVA